jgi:hypothetical protein
MLSLDEMIERAIDHAHGALIGRKDAQLIPTWVIQFKHQPATLIVTPWSGETKTMVIKAVTIWMRTHAADSYSFLSEAWMATENLKHPTGLTPSQREDRKECVIIHAGNHKDMRMRMLDIERGPDGVVTALPELNKDYTDFQGLLVNLLRS